MNKIILIFLILLAGAALRFYNLDKYSLWYDEAYGVLQAEIPHKVIAMKDNTPPLYMFFIYFWQRLTDSVFGLRLPSVIFGLASILMAYFLGKRLFNEKIGFVSAFLLAVSPFHIYYSQEARMYPFITLLTLLSVYFLILVFQTNKNLFFIGYIISNLLNIYCHYVGAIFWISQIAFLFIMRKKIKKQCKKKWYISNLIILFLFLPWVIFLIVCLVKASNPYLGNFSSPFWPPIPTVNSIFMTFKNFSVGYVIPIILYVPIISMFFFLFFKGIFSWKNKESVILCLVCIFTPIISFFAISKMHSFYVDRYFITGSVFYYYIVAAGIVSFKKRVSIFICIILLAVSLFSLKDYYENSLPFIFEERVGVQRKKDHQGIAEYISKEIQEGDGVYHTCRNTVFPFIYHFNKISSVKMCRYWGRGLSLVGDDSLKLGEFNVFGKYRDVSDTISINSSKRIWLVFSTWDFDNLSAELLEFKTVKFMNEKYKNISYKRFDGAIVYLYETSVK